MPLHVNQYAKIRQEYDEKKAANSGSLFPFYTFVEFCAIDMFDSFLSKYGVDFSVSPQFDDLKLIVSNFDNGEVNQLLNYISYVGLPKPEIPF